MPRLALRPEPNEQVRDFPPKPSFLDTAREIVGSGYGPSRVKPTGAAKSRLQPERAAPVLALQSQMHDLRPLPRTLTDDEIAFFSAAIDAGATLVPRLLRDYLSGVSCVPFQFEGCSASIWPGDQWAHPMVSENIVRRDAFLARWRDGDLAEVVARINAALARRAA